MARLIDPKTGTAVHVEGNLERRYRAQGWSEKITKRSSKPAAKPVEASTDVEDSGNASEAEAATGDASVADEAQGEATGTEQASAAPAEEATEAPATRRNTRRNK